MNKYDKIHNKRANRKAYRGIKQREMKTWELKHSGKGVEITIKPEQ